MTAGLPGAGIGGLFYLLMALFMPVCELAGAWRGRTPGRSLARGQAVLAGTILLAIWLTGWLLGLLVVAHSWSPAGPGAGAVAGAHLQVIGRSMVYLSLGTLGVVLAGVELLRLVVVRATPPKTVPLASEPEKDDLPGHEAA